MANNRLVLRWLLAFPPEIRVQKDSRHFIDKKGVQLSCIVLISAVTQSESEPQMIGVKRVASKLVYISAGLVDAPCYWL